MIELPPKFHDQNPVNPDADPLGMFIGTGRNRTRAPWKGTAGLAADIRYYGAWMREEAYKTDWASLSESGVVGWYFCYCSRVALGPHSAVCQPCLRPPDAFDEDFSVVKKERQ